MKKSKPCLSDFSTQTRLIYSFLLNIPHFTEGVTAKIIHQVKLITDSTNWQTEAVEYLKLYCNLGQIINNSISNILKVADHSLI